MKMDLSEIKARVEKATPGPWEWNGSHAVYVGPRLHFALPDQENYLADAEFIAHARTDIPALIEEVERLQLELHGMERERDEQLERVLRLDKWAWDLRAACNTANVRNAKLEAALKDVLDELHYHFGCDEQCIERRHSGEAK